MKKEAYNSAMSETQKIPELPTGCIEYSLEAAHRVSKLAGEFKIGLVRQAMLSGAPTILQQTDDQTAMYGLELSRRAVEIGVQMGDPLLTEEHVNLAAEEIAKAAA